MSNRILIPIEQIENAIYLIRGERVMLDRDLAKLYDVTTKALNQAVRRNSDRFPEDFLFKLTSDEVVLLKRSQDVTASEKHRGVMYVEAGVHFASLRSLARPLPYLQSF